MWHNRGYIKPTLEREDENKMAGSDIGNGNGRIHTRGCRNGCDSCPFQPVCINVHGARRGTCVESLARLYKEQLAKLAGISRELLRAAYVALQCERDQPWVILALAGKGYQVTKEQIRRAEKILETGVEVVIACEEA
ncbi:MAG TPA: hypothetical protein VJB17_02470 [Patescibacteria group bacterium]|nr:hypothetical protein [Patescibacteria group bacterium]